MALANSPSIHNKHKNAAGTGKEGPPAPHKCICKIYLIKMPFLQRAALNSICIRVT